MARKDLTLVLFLILVPIIYLSPNLLPSQTFYMRDLTYLFHPWRSLSAQFMQSGEMPLWNSYAMGGMPLLANGQSAIFYPGTVLFYSFHFSNALKIFYWAHFAFAALGFFMLSRKLEISRWASLAAGILFAYNGYVLTRIEFLCILGAVVWLPWSLLFVMCAEDYRKISVVCLALTLVYSFFSGFPQVFMMQAVFTFAFCIFKNKSFDAVKFFSIAGIIFLLLASILWLPMTELWLKSIRSGAGVALEEAGSYSLPFQALLGLIFPPSLPSHPDQFTWEKYFWIWSGWWGITATLVMIFSAAQFKKRIFWISFFFFALGLIWALGAHLPTYHFVYNHFFLLRLFRYPPVALFWTITGASFLTVLGIKQIESKWGVRVGLLILTLMTAELFIYSRNFHPTMNPDYYHKTYTNVSAIQADVPGTVLLSPKANINRKLPGKTETEAAMKFRSFLFDLTNLPYRIRTLNSSGEPLALLSFEKIWKSFEKCSFPDLAESMNLLNITHFLSYDDLKSNWTEISEDEDLRVYRNAAAYGEIFALEHGDDLIKQEPLKPKYQILGNNHLEAHFVLEKESIILTHIPNYPGWEVYCAEHGKHDRAGHPPSILTDFFNRVLEPGEHHLFFVYTPKLWIVSLGLFAAGLIAVIVLLIL